MRVIVKDAVAEKAITLETWLANHEGGRGVQLMGRLVDPNGIARLPDFPIVTLYHNGTIYRHKLPPGAAGNFLTDQTNRPRQAYEDQ